MRKLPIILIMILLCTVLLFSCGKGESISSGSQPSSTTALSQEDKNNTPVHKHTFAGEWIVAENGHYKECVCHPEIKEIAAHMDYVDRDGRCDVCMIAMAEEKVFTVTVLDKSGAPVENAKIKFYTMGDEKLVNTDKDGVASATFIYADNIKAMLVSLPEGYELPEKLVYSFYESSLTISLDSK